MKRFQTLSFLVLELASCTNKEKALELDLRGNWYTDIKDGEGIYASSDSLTNYCEFYVQDSTLEYSEESYGLGPRQQYFIKEDSIYKCFYIDPCNYIPLYKITKFNSDTLWLTINPAYANNHPNTFWVRLPKEEKGLYDHNWDESVRDSLEIQVHKDFDRRRWKFYSIRGNDMRGYDSALKAGYWNFTMAQIREERKKYTSN